MPQSKLFGAFAAAIMSFSLAACAGSLPPAGTAAYQATEYRLAAGDELQITVFGESSLTKEYVVSSAGDISFPLVGDIPVVNLSVRELQDKLIGELSQGYLNDPRVTAEVLNYRPFFILGEVSKPGQFPFSDQLTVYQAVALAGGFTYRADRGKVFIQRADTGLEETYDLKEGKPVYVSPGDTIRFGERFF
ncbi:MAG: polysaccharide biosynthesis/export family protein [Pseudomonadota bacterium]